ncbi:nucleoid-associated protein [Mucilaginibacter rubeus]|uniref:nucleoid-associated protein n=1 Tax=Mucilaginibacter rubeus TaxID=2027860 RepID=UPI001662B54B|nr:nucleoid-associated protein [Mucilaginibacter rubeus]GGB22860.1 hypothetical protein GCM10011500_43780 [Mucilaginibacter rubeus]
MEERQLILLNTSIFKIDLKGNTVSETALTAEDTDFYKYIRSSINEVSLAPGGRKFKLRSTNTEVVSTMLPIAINPVGTSFGQTIPNRLLREEIAVQDRVARMGIEVHEGLLIISVIEDRGVKKIVLCKVEDIQYIDKVDLKLNSGYPIRRKIFRSAQFHLSQVDLVENIVVHDLNSKGATYWWDDFLEIDQFWDDIYNTKTAFNIIDSKVLSKLKKESPADHTYLRNATIRFFRTNQEFTIEKLIEACFDNYEAVNATKVDIDKIKESIRKLPEKHSFDERFNLKPSEITAKIKYSINLTENIDLVIKDEINIESTITPELHNNRKYIKIRSDAGYDAFKK